MNVYKISYHVAGLGDTSTEARGRNEAEAKRNFKATEIGKAVPHSSISVEVIRENDLATKQEERDTLAAIRKMVEELGPQRPEPWMKRLVPKGEYIVMVGPYPLMLRPTPVRAEDIEAGHRYYHYTIDGRVYSGIFLGRDTAKGG